MPYFFPQFSGNYNEWISHFNRKRRCVKSFPALRPRAMDQYEFTCARSARTVVCDAPEGVDGAGWDEGRGNGIERWQVINGGTMERSLGWSAQRRCAYSSTGFNSIPFNGTLIN